MQIFAGIIYVPQVNFKGALTRWFIQKGAYVFYVNF